MLYCISGVCFVQVNMFVWASSVLTGLWCTVWKNECFHVIAILCEHVSCIKNIFIYIYTVNMYIYEGDPRSLCFCLAHNQFLIPLNYIRARSRLHICKSLRCSIYYALRECTSHRRWTKHAFNRDLVRGSGSSRATNPSISILFYIDRFAEHIV